MSFRSLTNPFLPTYHVGFTMPENDGSLAADKWNTANRAKMIPIWVPALKAFSTVAFCVQTSIGNLDVGFYSGVRAGTKTRLASTGSFACPAVGPRSVALAVTLLPGFYWLAMAADNAGFGLSELNSQGSPGARCAMQVCEAKSASFPLPATIAAPTISEAETAPYLVAF